MLNHVLHMEVAPSWAMSLVIDVLACHMLKLGGWNEADLPQRLQLSFCHSCSGLSILGPSLHALQLLLHTANAVSLLR